MQKRDKRPIGADVAFPAAKVISNLKVVPVTPRYCFTRCRCIDNNSQLREVIAG